MDDRLVEMAISSGAIVLLALAGFVLVHLVGRRMTIAVERMARLPDARRNQILTVIQIFRWSADILIGVVALLMLLSKLGLDITPLLASAGVAGLAISFGAQTLIKDIIGGSLVLLENQYTVGEFVEIAGVSGSVEQLTLRATQLRDLNGNLHTVPNGEVRVVTNMMREYSRAVVEVGVAYEEDIERVLQVMNEIAVAFAQDPVFGPRLLEMPLAQGPISLGDSAINMRMTVKVRPGQQLEIGRQLRKCIHATFAERNITIPYPRREIWLQPDAGSIES